MRVLNTAGIQSAIVVVLFFCVGLHLPRSFVGLWVVAICLLLGCNWRICLKAPLNQWYSVKMVSLAALLVSSVVSCLMMLYWGFWRLPGDIPDLVNGLFLPGLMLLAGFRSSILPRNRLTTFLLAYAIGGLIYVLLALLWSRVPWWDWSQLFPVSIMPPWGKAEAVNVRSVEQNAYPAVLLLPVCLLAMQGNHSGRTRWFVTACLLLSVLGVHALWSLEGRLGWLVLVFSALPVLFLLIKRILDAVPASFRSGFLFGGSGALLTGVFSVVSTVSSWQGSVGWSQGFCDERFALYGAFLQKLMDAPWGGRVLEIAFLSCDARQQLALSARGGTHLMVHNVFLDIYYTSGFVALAFLMVSVIPVFFLACRGFWRAWPEWDWQISLRWGWLCFLACQWMFQPLLYSDGILYYFSFFVFGALVPLASGLSRCSSGSAGGQSIPG